jgi:hypothetical protein
MNSKKIDYSHVSPTQMFDHGSRVAKMMLNNAKNPTRGVFLRWTPSWLQAEHGS